MPQPPPEVLLCWAQDALEDKFILQGLSARQPRLPAGGFDWTWLGPRNDPEWAWFFNRHHWFRGLHFAYVHHQDPRYLEVLLATLDDWITANPPPGRISFSPAWRPLEAARRLLGSWLRLWPELQIEPTFAPLRERLETSLIDHGRHLRHHHAFGGNHLVTEMLALLQLALLLPDKPNSANWLAYALQRLEHAYHDQVYPDGSYKELSTHYHVVVADNYHQLHEALIAAGRTDLASLWGERVQLLWGYLHAVMTPSGYNPLNNDSDLENLTVFFAEFAPDLAASPPAPTTHFPWAGQTVFRSACGSQWAFFDAGPRGSKHDHADLLSFTLSVGVTDFLTDNGRYGYRPGPWRDYFSGPASHNILLLDGHGSDQGPATLSSAPSTPNFRETADYTVAWGDTIFALGGNPRAADWRRIVIHLPGHGWIVIDSVVAFSPAALTTLWHWHPNCKIPVSPDPTAGLMINHKKTRLQTRLATTASADCTSSQLVSGQEKPTPQGWFSPRYNQRKPAPALLVQQTLEGPTVNVWLFTPGDLPTMLKLESATPQNTVIELSRGAQILELDINLDQPGKVQLRPRERPE